MARKYRVLCGVPEEHCIGGALSTDQRLGTAKCHGGHSDAYRCYARYLIRVKGFTWLGGRDYRPPDGGPIRILTKKIRFGSRLTTGKFDRFMPEKREAGNRGVIISC